MKIDKAWHDVGKPCVPEVLKRFWEALRSGHTTVEHGTTRVRFSAYDVTTGRKIGEFIR